MSRNPVPTDDWSGTSVPAFRLKKLYCEPYALNTAPNRTLEKAGFRFVKQHRTIPGLLNFEQDVNLWEISLENHMDSR